MAYLSLMYVRPVLSCAFMVLSSLSVFMGCFNKFVFSELLHTRYSQGWLFLVQQKTGQLSWITIWFLEHRVNLPIWFDYYYIMSPPSSFWRKADRAPVVLFIRICQAKGKLWLIQPELFCSVPGRLCVILMFISFFNPYILECFSW